MTVKMLNLDSEVMMKLNKTKKLFHKAYPFKVILHAEWLNHARLNNTNYHINNDRNKKFKKEIDSITNWVKLHNDKDRFKYRKEWNSLHIYFTERETISELKSLFGKNITSMWEPDEEYLDLLMSKKLVILANELPHDCRYKVFVKSSKMPTNIKQNLLKYANNNKDLVVIPGSLEEFLRSEKSYWWNTQLYFYVKNEKILLLIQMLVSGNVKDVYQIITFDEAEQERSAVNEESIENVS